MREQFFRISFQEIDFCWRMDLVDKSSNDYKIMSSLNNHLTNKESMPCSSHKSPNENVLHSRLRRILLLIIQITWKYTNIPITLWTTKRIKKLQNKPVVDVARDTQCCVQLSQTDTHWWMDRHCETIRASLACALRANDWPFKPKNS